MFLGIIQIPAILFGTHNVSDTGFCLYRLVQLSRFHLKGETLSSLRNVVCFKQKEDDRYSQGIQSLYNLCC